MLLWLLPGYSLFSIKCIEDKTNFKTKDKFIFGLICWTFYLVTSVLLARIVAEPFISRVLWLDYLIGLGLVMSWIVRWTQSHILSQHRILIRLKPHQMSFGATLPFLVPMIVFVFLVTLYTPLIFQYDALSLYLIIGKQLAECPTTLSTTWPAFGDVPPVLPVLYSWFYVLSNSPILRWIPLSFFSMTIFLVHTLAHKVFPKNPYGAYISVVSLVSMMALHWYMAKVSLYLDLGFLFFASSSIYILLRLLDTRSSKVIYFILGMSLTVTVLSKEYGLFHMWFVISILIFLCSGAPRKRLRSLLLSFFLLFPFVVYHLGGIAAFHYDVKVVLQTTIFRSILLVVFLPVLTLVSKNFLFTKSCFSKIIISVFPLFAAGLFFAHNFLLLGAPFGVLKDLYIQHLSKLGLTYANWNLGILSIYSFRNLFLTNAFMATNLIPFLAALLVLLFNRKKRLNNQLSSLVLLWFFYLLFIFYFIDFGQIEGSLIRRIFPLAIPVALLVGQGATYFNHNSWPKWLGSIVYTSIASGSLAYLWFFKLDGSSWWMTNFDSLVTSSSTANILEVLMYALPWLFLVLLILVNNKYCSKASMYAKKGRSIVIVTLLCVSAVAPAEILSKSVEFPKNWDPSYYDKADSIKSHTDNWHMPVIDFYRSQLGNDDSTTIGFGVTLLQYFLDRPFVDLVHPRNWLIYSPLLMPISDSELLLYLESFGARYFLIPTDIYVTRSTYDAASKNSTLFKLISTSAIVSTTEGQVFKFEKLAEFRSFELYVLNGLPH